MEFEDPYFLGLWCLVDRLGVTDVAEAFVASICRLSKIESANSSETYVILPIATSEYHKASLIQHPCCNPRTRKNGSCFLHRETVLLATSLMSVFTPFLKNMINSHFLKLYPYCRWGRLSPWRLLAVGIGRHKSFSVWKERKLVWK